MRIEELEGSVRRYAELEYARSSGPGGQNVNKVETKVRARIDPARLEGLSEAERDRASKQLANRLDALGCIYVAVDAERSRALNEGIALARLVELVAKAAKVPKRRKATKPTKASRERRLSSKRIRGAIKGGRKGPADEP